MLRSYVYSGLQKTLPSVESTERVLFISDNFTLSEYNRLFGRLSPLKNSLVVFLPQIFNIRVGDYLENIDPDAIKKMQRQYRDFTIKFAEMKNIIPVPFLYKGKKQEDSVNLKHFGYFKPSETGIDVAEFDYIKIKSKKMYLTARDMGFYNDFNYYPYRIPVLYKYNDTILVNAAVEAVRKYYRVGKKSVELRNKTLFIGKAHSLPLLSGGDIIIHRAEKKARTLDLKETLAAPDKVLNGKIIIVKSANVTPETMLSLGAVISGIIEGSYVKYFKTGNYFAAFLFFIGLLLLYRNIGPLPGLGVFFVFEGAVFAAAHLLLKNNIYIDTVLFSAVNIIVFSAVYFYLITSSAAERRKRVSILGRHMHPKTVRGFVSENRDILIKNTWFPTRVVYFNFSPGFGENPENIKKSFEKIREIIYNTEKYYIMKIQSGSDIALILPGQDRPLKSVLEPLFEARESLKEEKFNMVLNNTEIFIHEFNGEILIADKGYGVKLEAEEIERKKHILVPEKDIQEYINIIKFQKIRETKNNVMFNIAGIREEAQDEN